MRRRITILAAFLGGIYFFLAFVLPEVVPVGSKGINLKEDEGQILGIVQVIGAMAIGLGVINVLRVHGANVLRARRRWYNSLALIVAMVVWIVIGIMLGYAWAYYHFKVLVLP